MGGQPYWYFVPYEADVEHALQALREREFEAGRYYPATAVPFYSILKKVLPIGRRHETIDDALNASGDTGTRSILDIMRISAEPDDFAATPVPEGSLLDLYGTAQPTHRMVEDNMDVLEGIGRGQAVYVVVYRDGRPDELFFAGYSFD